MAARKLNALVAMSVYGREHNLSYPAVSKLLESGKLTYAEIGAEAPRKAINTDSEPDIDVDRTTIYDFESFPTKRCEYCGKKLKAGQNPGEKYCSYGCLKADREEKAERTASKSTDKPSTLSETKQRNKKIVAMYEAGISCSDIAGTVGLSAGSVYRIVRNNGEPLYDGDAMYNSPADCVFLGVRQWMDDHKCGYRELMALSDMWTNISSIQRRLNGTTIPKKDDIDEIIRITGKTYEELFTTSR